MRIDPWSSQQSTDYARLRDAFGIEEFTYQDALPEPPAPFRRGVIFGHRGFEPVVRAIRENEPWGVLTGLMPSGPMHFGHKMVIDQVKYYQSLGADVTIAVADIEAHVTRGLTLEACRKLAMEEYIENYLALGLREEGLNIYFQSEREQVKDLAWKLGRKVTFSTMEAIYGFTGETNMGHMHAPLVQVGDILHVQLPEFGGPRPVVVPVGVDQDPHIRLTRDLAAAHRWYNVKMHRDDKLGKVVGIFVKPDDDVARHIKRAEKALGKLGYADVHVNEAYKALYVAGTTEDVHRIDRALAFIESKNGGYGFMSPAATYHRFMSGLTGGKMSSSRPESTIALRDDPKVGQKKVDGALTGGRETAEEQRRLGAHPEKCMVYEAFVYHLVDDDSLLKTIWDESKSGARLCGDCKRLAKERVGALLTDLEEARKPAREKAEAIVRASRELALKAHLEKEAR